MSLSLNVQSEKKMGETMMKTALIGSIIVRQLLSRPTPNIVETELAKAAAGDHRDCAIQFRLVEKHSSKLHDMLFSSSRTCPKATIWP